MAKRSKYSRWLRLPGLYRTGQEKLPDPNEELQRLSHYVSWNVLDEAEIQAQRHGYASGQDYCTALLVQAIEAERVRDHIADVEAKHGSLAGLRAIADDPDYLAELSAAAVANGGISRTFTPAGEGAHRAPFDIHFNEPDPALPGLGLFAMPEPLHVDSPIPTPSTLPLSLEKSGTASQSLSLAAQVVLRHAGQLGGDDPIAFLPCLRRGQSVPGAEVAELAQALHQIEREYQGVPSMDRGLTFALHRLAFESQILHTDAWPGTFDVWTVDMLRAVQEAVERILSGQDIRYYPSTTGSVHNSPPRPESPR